jgi:hypothetical protein
MIKETVVKIDGITYIKKEIMPSKEFVESCVRKGQEVPRIDPQYFRVKEEINRWKRKQKRN